MALDFSNSLSFKRKFIHKMFLIFLILILHLQVNIQIRNILENTNIFFHSHEERAKFTNFSQVFGRKRHCGSFHVAFPRLVAPKILADSFEDLRGG